MWKEPNIYLRAIPARHRELSGIGTFRSRLLELGTRKVDQIWSKRRGHEKVSPAAYCVLKCDGRREALLVNESIAPKLVEAIVALGEGVTRGERRLRYLRVFHACECLVNTKDPELLALRHGLSHAHATLSHPRTLITLANIFGTTRIDLSLASHRRLFDKYFGTLLMRVDEEVVSRLDVQMTEWQVVPQSVHVLTPRLYARYARIPPIMWRTAGIPRTNGGA